MVRADHDGRYRPLPVATADRIRCRPQAGLVRKEFDRQVVPVRRRTFLSPGDGITAGVDPLDTTIDEVPDRSLCREETAAALVVLVQNQRRLRIRVDRNHEW